MAANYSYSVILEPQEGGGFTVLVPALPEVVTEGDTETRVTRQYVSSWQSVRVAMQPVNSADDAFRFCLNFDNARGEEQQQFFRYSSERVTNIGRPEY